MAKHAKRDTAYFWPDYCYNYEELFFFLIYVSIKRCCLGYMEDMLDPFVQPAVSITVCNIAGLHLVLLDTFTTMLQLFCNLLYIGKADFLTLSFW